MVLSIYILPILNDNYCYILQSSYGHVAVVDPGEAQPVLDRLHEHDLPLHTILNTHHHGDHIAGNATLMEKTGAKLIAPKADQHRIQNIDKTVSDGDKFRLGDEEIHVIETPGHTSGHVAFYAPQSQALFSGDTLFVMGCGRLFEGTAEEMYQSLQRLAALPDETKIYCGHEYTAANQEFCLSVEPDNEALLGRALDINIMRANNEPTVPSTIAQEKATNVFLRAKTATEFARLRTLKDNF